MKLFFKSKVPVKGDINFSRWIPEYKDRISIEIDSHTIMSLYFVRDSINLITRYDEMQVSSLNNNLYIPLEKFCVDFEIDIDDNLGNYILESCKPINELKDTEVKSLINIFIESIEKYVNRLIEFVSANKGQYWLQTIHFDREKLNTELSNIDFKVSANGSDFIEFCMNYFDTIIVNVNGSENGIIENNWQDIADFIKSNSRTNLSLELLSNAKLLLENGYGRSAIIEVCSALETAVNEFAKIKDHSWLKRISDYKGISSESIKTQIEHLRFSGTVKILFPILLDKTEISQSILSDCERAIEIRNNVVHNGQRTVKLSEIKGLIKSIEQLIKFLLQKILPNLVESDDSHQIGKVKITLVNN